MHFLERTEEENKRLKGKGHAASFKENRLVCQLDTVKEIKAVLSNSDVQPNRQEEDSHI